MIKNIQYNVKLIGEKRAIPWWYLFYNKSDYEYIVFPSDEINEKIALIEINKKIQQLRKEDLIYLDRITNWNIYKTWTEVDEYGRESRKTKFVQDYFIGFDAKIPLPRS